VLELKLHRYLMKLLFVSILTESTSFVLLITFGSISGGIMVALVLIYLIYRLVIYNKIILSEQSYTQNFVLYS